MERRVQRVISKILRVRLQKNPGEQGLGQIRIRRILPGSAPELDQQLLPKGYAAVADFIRRLSERRRRVFFDHSEEGAKARQQDEQVQFTAEPARRALLFRSAALGFELRVQRILELCDVLVETKAL